MHTGSGVSRSCKRGKVSSLTNRKGIGAETPDAMLFFKTMLRFLLTKFLRFDKWVLFVTKVRLSPRWNGKLQVC